MGKLLLLFIVLPAVELALLIWIGTKIGPIPTVALIIVTGMLGASLARWQGLGVLAQMQAEMRAGRLPAGSIVDGIILLIAGALLITPGVITDVFGFLCLIPGTRALIKVWVWHKIQRAIEEGKVQVTMHGTPGGDAPPGGFPFGGFPDRDLGDRGAPRPDIQDIPYREIPDDEPRNAPD